MYTEQDYADICTQKKKRTLLLLLPLLLMLALLVYSLIVRIELLTTLTTIAAGILSLFVHGLFIKPVSAYAAHIDQVLHGRVRTLTGAFKEMETETTLRDGVLYYGFLLNVGRMNDEEDDRLFYWDANLPLPDWKKGERITVTHHDKALGAWERAEA